MEVCMPTTGLSLGHGLRPGCGAVGEEHQKNEQDNFEHALLLRCGCLLIDRYSHSVILRLLATCSCTGKYLIFHQAHKATKSLISPYPKPDQPAPRPLAWLRCRFR